LRVFFVKYKFQNSYPHGVLTAFLSEGLS